jgi:hypothetical protein
LASPDLRDRHKLSKPDQHLALLHRRLHPQDVEPIVSPWSASALGQRLALVAIEEAFALELAQRGVHAALTEESDGFVSALVAD